MIKQITEQLKLALKGGEYQLGLFAKKIKKAMAKKKVEFQCQLLMDYWSQKPKQGKFSQLVRQSKKVAAYLHTN